MLDELLPIFMTFFVTIDPVGLAPIFIGLTMGMTMRQKRLVAVRAVLIALFILIVFAIAGKYILDGLGISLSAFRIAGGLMLLWTGFEMVFEKRNERKQETADKAVADHVAKDIASFPLALPLMAGPGAITAAILLMGRYDTGTTGQLTVLGMIVANLALCLIVFIAASPIDRLLGRTGSTVLSRLLGILLAALAVQYVADGVRAIIGA